MYSANLDRPQGAEAVLLLGHGGGHSKDSPRFNDFRGAMRTRRAWPSCASMPSITGNDRTQQPAVTSHPAGTHAPSTESWKTGKPRPPLWRRSARPSPMSGSPWGPSSGSRPSQRCQRSGRLCSSPEAYRAAAVSTILNSGSRILDAASTIDHCQVLMLNKTDNEIFLADDVHAIFDAVPGTTKELLFWDRRARRVASGPDRLLGHIPTTAPPERLTVRPPTPGQRHRSALQGRRPSHRPRCRHS